VPVLLVGTGWARVAWLRGSSLRSPPPERHLGRHYPPGVRHALAVDVGGTKLEAGVVDEDGRLLRRARRPTAPAAGDAESLFGALAALVGEVAGGDEVVCGVGSGGPMSAGGATVSPLNIPAWRRFPLRARLADATGLATFVDNDAKALALAEGWCGAAAGITDFLAMVVSTGVGGGLVLDGRLLDGAGGNAGHVGHVVVEPDGRRCACGGQGCLEAEASGTAVAAATGRPAAEAGPAVVARTGRLVGRAVASVANLLDLRLAVVAGSVALGFGAPFFAAAQEEVDRRARLEFSSGARIVPAGLGDAGPLVGAAAVGWRGLGERLLTDGRGPG
jgi:glucokinase